MKAVAESGWANICLTVRFKPISFSRMTAPWSK